jgi:hypothetical protein
MGSVGPSQILVCINGRIKLFDRTGKLDNTVLNITTDAFFASVITPPPPPPSTVTYDSSDCRVRYDRDSQRWYVVMIDTVPSNNRIMIAVSSQSTITAANYFSFYQFNQDVVTPAGDTGSFADYPTLGIDHNALYIGTNMFNAAGTAYLGSTGFVVQKSSLTSGGPIVATALRGIADSNEGGAYTPQGVDNDDATATKGFFVGIDNSSLVLSSTPSTRMVAIRVANPGSVSPAPSIDATISITVPPFGLAMGGVLTKGNSHPVDDVDNRLMMGQMKNGSLWTTHAIQVDSTGTQNSSGGRDGARWYEITGLQANPPAPLVHQSGTLFSSAATNPSSYFVPSIAASGQGHVAIGATSAGKAEYCEVSVAGRLQGDPLNTLRAPTIAQSSSTAYNFSTSNPQRWGDFSFTHVDPNDNMTFWTFQEYCNASASYAVRVIQLQAPPPATPASVNVSAVPVNVASQDVIITGNSVNGSGFYDPGSAFPNRLQVSIGGNVTVNSVYYDATLTPTSVKVNISTVGASIGNQDVTVTNPDTQVRTGTGILKVSGPPTCVVTPSGTSTNASPIVFTLTFSEAVSGLSTGGLVVTGGTIGTLSTLNPATYTVSVTPSGQGAVTCQVAAGAAQAVSDSLANLASNVATVTYDTVPPLAPVILSPTNGTLTNNNLPTVSGTAEAGSTVTLRDGATLVGTTVTTGGGTWSLIPSGALADGVHTLSATATDAAGNVSPASTAVSITVDTVPPTCVVTGPASPTNANPIIFTLTFSKTVTGLTATGIAVTNGTKGALSGTGTTYTIPVTPTADGTVTCQVTAGACKDLAGNLNTASNVDSVTSDRTPPTCTVTGPASPTNANPITFTLTFSTTVTGLTAGGITVTNGTKGALSGTGTTYTIPVTPTADGTVTCQVMAGAAVDLAGNASVASNVDSVTSDRTPPTCTVTGPASPTNASPITFTLTFSKTVTSLTAAGIAVGNGTKGTLSGSGTTYTLPVTPSADGPVTCQVPAGAAQDLAGNPSTASNVCSVTSDRTPPTCTVTGSATPTNQSPIVFTLTFSEAVTALTAGGITVTNGTKGALSGTGTTYTIPIAPSADGTVTCQVTAGAALDLAGNPSTASNVGAVTSDRTPPGAPGAPTGTPNPNNTGNFTLSWTAASDGSGSGVANYTVQRSQNGGAYSTVATGVAGTSLAQSSLGPGSYRYQVQAVDNAGNVGPFSAVSAAVVVDTTAPHTTILFGPPKPSSSSGATFVFASSQPGCTFQTSLDGAAWTSNGTATMIAYMGLSNAAHTFQVRAVDAAGNVDPSPPSYAWTINTSGGVNQPPSTMLTGQPPNPTAQTTATFTFISSEAGGTFQVQLDGGGWISNGASGTKTYTGLTKGSHTFLVRAIDTASNVDPAPPSYTWLIVAPPVDATAPLLNLFSDDVSLTNWTVTGTDAAVTWAVDGTPASMIGNAYHSAPSSLNYNNGTDYDTPGVPNSGSATSPSIAISGLTGARLKFFCNYQTETLGTDHDVRTVQVSNDGFTTLLVNETLSTTPGSALAGPCAAMGTWHEHIVPLTGFTGPIQVRFSFNTIDAGLNNFPGWFVDDFEISDLMVSELNQADGGSGPALSVGGTTSSPNLNVTALVSADATGIVTLEVEVQPVGTAFTGTPTASTVGSGAGTAVSLSIPLPDGSYHWRARTVTGGVTSSWMSFGLNAETDPDLIIQTAHPATGGGGGGGSGGGGCGSVGLDALLVLLGAMGVRKRGSQGRR